MGELRTTETAPQWRLREPFLSLRGLRPMSSCGISHKKDGRVALWLGSLCGPLPHWNKMCAMHFSCRFSDLSEERYGWGLVLHVRYFSRVSFPTQQHATVCVLRAHLPLNGNPWVSDSIPVISSFHISQHTVGALWVTSGWQNKSCHAIRSASLSTKFFLQNLGH